MARLIRVIQGLPTDRISALGVSLSVAETGITRGELARRIYHVLSDRRGFERALTAMATKDRLVLMMIASSPQGRSTVSRLGAEAPFSSYELSGIVARLGDLALLQVTSHEQGTWKIEMPVEIRSLLQPGARHARGRIDDDSRRRSANRRSTDFGVFCDRTGEEVKSAGRFKRPRDPVSDITAWANRNRLGQSSGGNDQRKPKDIRLAETLGLWDNVGPSKRLVEQWLALANEDRRAIALRAWLHDNQIVFSGRPGIDIPARRLVRMALVAKVAKGMGLEISAKPLQIEEGLKMTGLDWPVSLPGAGLRSMVKSIVEDLYSLGLMKSGDGGLHIAASMAAGRICASALEV